MTTKPSIDEFLNQARQSPIFSQFFKTIKSHDKTILPDVLPPEKLNHRLPGEEWIFDGDRYDCLVNTPYHADSLHNLSQRRNRTFYGQGTNTLIHSIPIASDRIDKNNGNLLFPKFVEIFNSNDDVINCIDVFLSSLSDNTKRLRKTKQEKEIKSRNRFFNYLRQSQQEKKELSFDKFYQELNQSDEIFYHKSL